MTSSIMFDARTIHRLRSFMAIAVVSALFLPWCGPGYLEAADSDSQATNTTTAATTAQDLSSTNTPPGTMDAPGSGTTSTPTNSATHVVSVSTASTNTGPTFATALDYPSFKIIADRNIFNPNRSVRSRGGGGRGGGTPEPKPIRIESFSLVGTMTYGSNQMAFFDSSTPRYRKAIKSGDTIADHKILSINVQGIRLEREGKQFDMTMGSQMRREDDAPWELKVASTPAPRTPTSASSTGTDSSGSSSSSGADNDVVKRLLQKREQELNK